MGLDRDRSKPSFCDERLALAGVDAALRVVDVSLYAPSPVFLLSEWRSHEHDSSHRVRAPASWVPPPSHRVTMRAHPKSTMRLRSTPRRVDSSKPRSAVTTPPHRMSTPAFPATTQRCLRPESAVAATRPTSPRTKVRCRSSTRHFTVTMSSLPAPYCPCRMTARTFTRRGQLSR